jgi:GNAT superfamily N-acetyltransferase
VTGESAAERDDPARGGIAPRAITVREARADDEEHILGLVPRFVEHGYADGHTAEEVIDGTRRVLREALHAARTDEVFLIAEDDRGERGGFAYAVTQRDFFTDEPYAHISEIATVQSGDGTGTRLMDAVETWARERGYRFISLNVLDDNARARRLYARRGYEDGHRHLVKRLHPADEAAR